MKGPRLVEPSEEYRESFLEALKEYHVEGRKTDVSYDELRNDFHSFVEAFRMEERGENLASDRVAQTTRWLVEGTKYIGGVSIRHTLTEHLRMIGGHIGYEVRPTERRKGYGALILKLALPLAKELGIERALLTCNVTNEPSRKIIESAGGKLVDEVEQGGGLPNKARFWIDTDSH